MIRVSVYSALLSLALLIAMRPAVGSAGPAPAPAATYEMSFLHSMAAHHSVAISMSRLCLDRASHAEVRNLCQGIIAAQTAEIGKLQSYMEDWMPSGMSMGMSGMGSMDMTGMDMMASNMSMPGAMAAMPDAMADMSQAEMGELRASSGSAFDRLFLQDMVKHHQAAVQMSQECGTKAHHAELTSLCKGIITEQSNEIAMMRGWLRQWYGEQMPAGS